MRSDTHSKFGMLGSPVVPFYPFSFWVPLLKPNSRKQGTLTIKGLLGKGFAGGGGDFRVRPVHRQEELGFVVGFSVQLDLYYYVTI